jgi:hypothetical protein
MEPNMTQIFRIPIIALGLIAFSAAAQADEEMDRIIEAASPHMHHSCESILETYPDDEQSVAEIIRLMAMVSLYNRQIDVLAAVPDEADREGLKDKFVEELEDSCDDDPGRLLSGAVDEAVMETMEGFE